MHFAALANICEKSSDLANGLRLYNEALEYHAIKLDNKQEDYYASQGDIPMMVMDPESRHKLFKNVIYSTSAISRHYKTLKEKSANLQLIRYGLNMIISKHP